MVDNKGSIARDILAAERTFLAWARTGLGFVGAGSALFAAHNNDDIIHQVRPACAILLANGAFLLTFATRRYLAVINAIQHHSQFPIQIKGALFAVALTGLGTISSIGIVAQAKTLDKRRGDSVKEGSNRAHEVD